MLTDIFADRYEGTTIPYANLQHVKRFMMQASLMITNQLFSLYEEDEENCENSAILSKIHRDVCMELGVQQLTAQKLLTKRLSIREQTANFLGAISDADEDLDRRIRERLSFVELAFREYESHIERHNENLESRRMKVLGDEKLAKLANRFNINEFKEDMITTTIGRNVENMHRNLHELRERFKRAGLPLTYSSGYIQFSDDSLVEDSIKRPFWIAINDPKWASVEHDMHVAIDLRDTGRTGAAASAAKALESTIKIISNEKGWDRGNEKGAAQYIDNLVSEKNGRFIEVWEANVLKSFFAEVRNRLQHGAGSEPVTILSKQQDDWAIETCMSWIKSLVNRV